MEGLPAERRAELVDLLADERAFEQSHPAVAEYLRTVRSLPPSSEPHQRIAEDEFEVRVLHFLTGGQSSNPYWDVVAPAVATSEAHPREVNGGSDHPSSRLRYAQTLLQSTYAYAIPSPEIIGWMSNVTDDRPVVEIGAGRGYWARQLTEAGLNIAAYDSAPPIGRESNSWFPSIAGVPDCWYEVHGLRALAAATRERGNPVDHLLFLCWPPGWGHPMAARALRAYERLGGDALVFVGDPTGDRSASPEFFQGLAERWRMTDRFPDHVVWQGLHDVAELWVRSHR